MELQASLLVLQYRACDRSTGKGGCLDAFQTRSVVAVVRIRKYDSVKTLESVSLVAFPPLCVSSSGGMVTN